VSPLSSAVWRCHVRYYLNGSDAYRLKLLLPLTEEIERQNQEREAAKLREEAGAIM